MGRKLFNWLKGYIILQVRGKDLTSFLNFIWQEGLMVWRVNGNVQTELKLRIALSDFFRLIKYRQQLKIKIRIIDRRGFPFLFNKIIFRPGLWLGFLLFIISLYISTSLVWKIEVNGNKLIPTETIIVSAEQIGIKKWAWKNNLANYDLLQREMLERLPDSSWIGIKIEGTTVIITVVEKKLPSNTPLTYPQHLVAKKDAIIERIIAYKGKALVKRNQLVRKGDILISGIIGTEGNLTFVPAQGEVRGIVWYETTLEIPLLKKSSRLTGEVITRNYLYFFNRSLKIKGEKIIPYKTYKQELEYQQISWGTKSFPFGLITEKIFETKVDISKLKEEEALKNALEVARKDLLRSLDNSAELIQEKVLQQKLDRDKLIVKVLFETSENIAQELILKENE